MRGLAIAVSLALSLASASAALAQQACRTLPECDALIRANPTLAAYERRAFLHLTQRKGLEDVHKAIADFSAAIALEPARALSMYGRGMARLMSGDSAGQNEMEAAIMLEAGVEAEFKRQSAP